MPISLILTPFDYFQIRPTFEVTPNLIIEPCPMKRLFSLHVVVKLVSSLGFYPVAALLTPAGH